MKRAFVFIDGSNFYYRLRELLQDMPKSFRPSHFSYQNFLEFLVMGSELIASRYYIGAVRRQSGNEKSERLFADQQKLLATLQRQRVKVVFGHLIQHPDRTYHEKGVDVRIAVEMIRFARENRYDVAYLLSSDTDLVPAVEEVKLLGKEVVFVGTTKKQSFGLIRACDETKLLSAQDVEKFFYQQ